MDLSGIWHCVQALADSRERSCDKIRGALLAHAKHHGGPDIKGVALSVVMPRTPARNNISARPSVSNCPEVGGISLHSEGACMPLTSPNSVMAPIGVYTCNHLSDNRH
jgi:hypothetical protein